MKVFKVGGVVDQGGGQGAEGVAAQGRTGNRITRKATCTGGVKWSENKDYGWSRCLHSVGFHKKAGDVLYQFKTAAIGFSKIGPILIYAAFSAVLLKAVNKLNVSNE